MFAKLTSFFVVYILALINFIFILSPFSILLIFDNKIVNKNLISIFYLLIFISSFLMLILLIINYLFNSTVKKYKKAYINCSKNKERFGKLLALFNKEKHMFNISNVCLLIQNTETVNAYAVGGFRENCIVITTGIMELCKKNSKDETEYYELLSGIIGHELSHIINKDFFPSLLVITNNKVNKVISFIVFMILNVLSRIVSFIPVIGLTISNLFVEMHSFMKFFMNFFYSYIFIPVYRFIQLQVSKSIEYRADTQSAKYCGGDTMSKTLSLLGNNGFFSIFSTHPKTMSRIKKVSLIKQSNDYIRPTRFANLSILLSFLLLLYFVIVSYRLVDFKYFYTYFYTLYDSLRHVYQLIRQQLFMINN